MKKEWGLPILLQPDDIKKTEQVTQDTRWMTVFCVQAVYLFLTLLTFFVLRRGFELRVGFETSVNEAVIATIIVNIAFTFAMGIAMSAASVNKEPIFHLKKAKETTLIAVATTSLAIIPVSVVAAITNTEIISAPFLALASIGIVLAGLSIAFVAKDNNLPRMKLTLSFLAEAVLIFLPMYFWR